MKLLIFLAAFGAVAFGYPDPKATKNTDKPIITTPLGQVQGSILASRQGKQIFSFRGIPYAKPPINDLRFQPPVAVEKWTHVINATQDAPLCPQPTSDPTSEDCLFLNVYTTRLPKEKDPSPSPSSRPVLVFLHAGGFSSLGAASTWLGPQYLLDQELVLVTLNYRLGTLGFLSTGDKEAPGNNGLKDQVEALKWVKSNIHVFGGDPDAVTLVGYSAGAASVTLHLVSPMSKGLFHRGVIMSGSSLGQWPVPSNQLELAKRQAKILGCPDDSSASIVKCFKTKTASELGDLSQKLQEFGDDPVILWSPVVEADHGQARFLTQHPIALIQSGEFHKVPVILGITTDEFAGRAFNVIANATLKEELSSNWEKNAPIAFIYERDSDTSKKISADLKHFYLNHKTTLDNTSLPGLAQLYADSIIGFGVHNAAQLLAEKSDKDVFFYRFNYKGRYSHFYLPESNGTIPFGVVHHDDLIYLFYIQKLFPLFKDTDQETQTVNKLTTLWANFAKTGNPIPATTETLDNVKWEPYNVKTQKYLDIGNKLVLNEKLYEKRYAEWTKLFPNEKFAHAKTG